MTNTSDLPLCTIDRIALEGSKAARAGDNRTHGALHVVETRLRELRISCLEAERVISGDELLTLLAIIRAPLTTPGTPESAALIERLIPSEQTHVDTAI